MYNKKNKRQPQNSSEIYGMYAEQQMTHNDESQLYSKWFMMAPMAILPFPKAIHSTHIKSPTQVNTTTKMDQRWCCEQSNHHLIPSPIIEILKSVFIKWFTTLWTFQLGENASQ